MRKHILFLSGGLKIGGVERILVEYLNNIDQDKYDITLFLMSDFGEDAILKHELNNNIDVRYIKSLELVSKKKELRKKKKNIFYKLKYMRILKKEKKDSYINFIKYLEEISKVDIIIDFDGSFIKYTKYMKDITKLIWIHASIIELEKHERINIAEFGDNLNKYDRIVAICNEMSEELRSLYPLLSDRISVLYNPFDIDRIVEKSFDRSELTKNEENLLKENYLVTVSRIEKIQKDIPTLIKAYKILKENQ